MEHEWTVPPEWLAPTVPGRLDYGSFIVDQQMTFPMGVGPLAQQKTLNFWNEALTSDFALRMPGRTVLVADEAPAMHRWYREARMRDPYQLGRSVHTVFTVRLLAGERIDSRTVATIDVLTGRYRVG